MEAKQREFFQMRVLEGYDELPDGCYPFIKLKDWMRIFHPEILKEFMENWDEVKRKHF